MRDLAALLDGTKAQFGVAWKDGAVNLNSATPYGESAEQTPFSGARRLVCVESGKPCTG